MNKALLFCLASLCSLAAHASSNDAWAAYDKRVAAACAKASALKNVQVASPPAQFDDRVGYTALLLQGRYPQAHMKNQRGRELCLYDKKSKRAFVTEWDAVLPRP